MGGLFSSGNQDEAQSQAVSEPIPETPKVIPMPDPGDKRVQALSRRQVAHRGRGRRGYDESLLSEGYGRQSLGVVRT
jgi:hypothetical protein